MSLHSSKPQDLVLFNKLHDPMLLEEIMTDMIWWATRNDKTQKEWDVATLNSMDRQISPAKHDDHFRKISTVDFKAPRVCIYVFFSCNHLHSPLHERTMRLREGVRDIRRGKYARK